MGASWKISFLEDRWTCRNWIGPVISPILKISYPHCPTVMTPTLATGASSFLEVRDRGYVLQGPYTEIRKSLFLTKRPVLWTANRKGKCKQPLKGPSTVLRALWSRIVFLP